MKKRILIVLLVLVLCLSVFAACNDEGLEKARDYVKALYRDEAASTSTSYSRTTSVKVDGVSYSVDWTITNKDSNAPESAVVGEKKDGMVTIDIDTYSTEKVEYVLTATISNEKGKTTTVEFERFVPAFVINTYDEYIAACKANDGATVIKIKAYVIGVVNYESSSKGSLYLQDADGHGYYAYSPKDAAADCASTDDLRAKWPVGTEVIVSGTVTTFSGQYEYNKNCEVIKTGNTIESSQLGYTDATADFAAATSNEDTNLGKYQNARVTLKDATITGITIEYNTDGSFKRVYYYFTLPNSEVKFNVYYTIYFINETTMRALHDQLAVGKIVDLTGIVSVYSNDFQLYPDSAISVSNVRNAEYTDAEKVALAKENLTFESGTATTTEVELPATGELGTTITWAFKDGATYDFAAIADGKLKVTALPSATTKITLVATITSGDASDTKEFTYTVSSASIEFTSFADATEIAGTEKNVYTTDKYYMVGTIKEVTNAQYGNMTIEDTAGNTFTVYGTYDATGANRYDAIENAPKAGDIVVVYGVLGYYSAPQMKNGWIIASYSPKTFADATTLAGTAKNVYTTDKYYMVGTIKEVTNAQYGNMTIEDAAGNTFTVYGTYDATGANRYDAMANAPKAGDVVVVYGVLGYYSAPQMKNGWIVLSYTPATSSEGGGEGSEGGEGGSGTEGGTDTPATTAAVTVDCTKGTEALGLTVTKTGDYTAYGGTTKTGGIQKSFTKDGVTFVNDIASSTSEVVVKSDSEHIRCYKNSTVTIGYTGMTKIVITTEGGDYKFKGTESLSVEGAIITVDGTTATIVFTEAVDSVTITLSANQVRVKTIEIYTAA